MGSIVMLASRFYVRVNFLIWLVYSEVTVDLRLLEVFCCVYDERSFSKAAKKLGLTQPTISGHIKSLESSLGTTLFDRLGRHIGVTSAGELLYRHGLQVVHLKRTTEEAMTRFLNRLEGDLHLGASSIPGEYLLPPAIGRFRNLYPQVRVSLEIHDTQEIIRRVKRGRVELGFVGARASHPVLEFQRFAEDELTLVTPQCLPWSAVGDEVQLAELKRLPLLVRERGSGSRMVLEARLYELGADLESFNIVAELGSTTAIVEAIRSRLGASILSNLSVHHEVESGQMRRLRILGTGPLVRSFYTVRNTQRIASPLAEVFLEHQLAEAGASGTAA